MAASFLECLETALGAGVEDRRLTFDCAEQNDHRSKSAGEDSYSCGSYR